MAGFSPYHQQHVDFFERHLDRLNKLAILHHIPNSIDRRVADRLKSRVADGLKSKVEIVHPWYVNKFGSYPEKTGELTVPCVTSLGVTQTVPSHYDHISSPLYPVSDPGKFHFADRFDPNYKGAADRFRSDSAYKEAIQNTGMSGASGSKGKDGEPTKDDPGKFHFPDRFDPNYEGAADRFRSDSAYKEAIQNTGMSGASTSKGKDGEPTKDDERTLAWKLRLSAEAVTPKFNASANLNLEMKSGSGSNSKPPPLPPMLTPLACKLYDCLLGCKKKFID